MILFLSREKEMDKKAILAIVLCLIIWIAWDRIFLKRGETPPVTPRQEKVHEEEVMGEERVKAEREEIEPVETPPSPEFIPYLGREGARRYEIDRINYNLFVDGSGDIVNLLLKKYMRKSERKTILGVLWETLKSGRWRGESFARPLSDNIRPVENLPLFHISLQLNGAEEDLEGMECLEGEEGISCSFMVGDHIEVTKEYLFDSDSYYADLNIKLKSHYSEDLEVTFNGQFAKRYDEKNKITRYNPSPVIILRDAGKARKHKLRKIPDKLVERGDFEWVSFSDKYFLLALIVKNRLEEFKVFKEGTENYITFSSNLVLTPGVERAMSYRIYFGPKRIDILKRIAPGLEQTIEFGFFEIFARPILYLLNFFNSIVNSYGISIIILTLFIKMILFPLTHKSYKSMKDMQKIQPEIARLKEKYKDDRERLNKEMLELFKVHKINPMSGCLPMLLQMPIWFALYQVLLNAIELYNTPFLYLDDLSSKDAYCISPLILGVTMFIQQKMTPSTITDPTQAKMMQLMPLFFAVIMFSLPSGLVLYILVNTILTIIQQWIINRIK